MLEVGFGRRTVKTEPTIVGGTTTKNYAWAGWSQVSGSQAPVVGSSLDSPIRLERGTDNSVRVPVQDSHGNVTKVISPTSGGQLFGASYSPFGERNITYAGIAGTDGKGQPLGFTGAEHDAVSELVYMRNRYYAPGLGRFISEDPIGFDGGENFYAYCSNDPINFSDPLGLWESGDGFGGYFGDVGRIFGGYGRALNPANWWRGLKGTAAGLGYSYECNGAGWGGMWDFLKTGGQGFVNSLAGENGMGAFGEATMGTLMMAAPGIAKIPSPKGLGQIGRLGSAGALGTSPGWLSRINPKYPLEGFTENCVNCAIATERTLGGAESCAMPSAGTSSVGSLAKALGGQFGKMTSLEAIEAQMLQAGPGARGVIAAFRDGKAGHAFNVVNHDGTVVFLDGQSGTFAQPYGQGYIGFQLMRL